MNYHNRHFLNSNPTKYKPCIKIFSRKLFPNLIEMMNRSNKILNSTGLNQLEKSSISIKIEYETDVRLGVVLGLVLNISPNLGSRCL